MNPERPLSTEEQRIASAMGKYRNTAYDNWWESKNPIFLARHQIHEPVLLADRRAYARGLELICGREISPDELQAGDREKHEKLKAKVIDILRKKDNEVLKGLQKAYAKNPEKMRPSIYPDWGDEENPRRPKEDLAEPRRFLNRSTGKLEELAHVTKTDEYNKKKLAEYINENRANPWWESTNPITYARHAMGLFTYMTHQHPMIMYGDFNRLQDGVSLILGRKVAPHEFSISYGAIKEELREKLEKWDEITYRRMTGEKK